jgi:hypothetical protein
MNFYRFRVVFGLGTDVVVSAFCENEAKIIAQAIRIKMALSYNDVVRIVKL